MTDVEGLDREAASMLFNGYGMPLKDRINAVEALIRAVVREELAAVNAHRASSGNP